MDPPPELGDATAVGYLRHLEFGRSLAWWLPGDRLTGSTVRSVMAFRISPVGESTRLVERFSWDASGWMGWPVLRLFQIADTIMALRQLLNLRRRVERYGGRSVDPAHPEAGERDQYQLYQVIYASGETAGTEGKEKATKWRGAALQDGVGGASLGVTPEGVR